MSLTSELNDGASPVRQHLERRFSILGASKRGSPLAVGTQHLLGLDDIPKEPAFPTLVSPALRGVVGTAIDYRIRYYFDVMPARELVAYQGALLWHSETLVERFYTQLDLEARQLSPAGRRLDQDDEERLCRYCIILAHFENLYRAGPGINSPLDTLPKRASLENLLALAHGDAVKDMVQLSWGFREDARLPGNTGWLWDLPHVLNPTFAGSADIAGADADLVLQDALWEFKALGKPRPSDVRDAILQLLGYTLLDYDDSYHIRTIVLYLLRHRPGTRSWPLWMFVFPPAEVLLRQRDGRLPSEDEVDARLESLRGEFRRLLFRGTCDCPVCAESKLGLGHAAGKAGE